MESIAWLSRSAKAFCESLFTLYAVTQLRVVDYSLQGIAAFWAAYTDSLKVFLYPVWEEFWRQERNANLNEWPNTWSILQRPSQTFSFGRTVLVQIAESQLIVLFSDKELKLWSPVWHFYRCNRGRKFYYSFCVSISKDGGMPELGVKEVMLLIELPRLINIVSLSAHLFLAGWLRVQIVPCRVHQHVHCKVVAIFCEKLSKCLSWHFQLKAALIYLSKTVVALWKNPMLSELRLHHGLSTPFNPLLFDSRWTTLILMARMKRF